MLVALFNATNGESWENDDNWLSSAPIGEWHGVEVNAEGSVTKLDISYNQLIGGIPPELGNLTSLEHLALYKNQLSGEIPPELGNPARLTTLIISGNTWSGCLPASLRDTTVAGAPLGCRGR